MGKLRVDLINKLSSFKEIRDDWEQLYKSDANSNLYISWLWLYSLFSTASFQWEVLGVKNTDTSSYVAFYPYKNDNRKLFGICTIRGIVYAGKPIAAYSGFLCAPDFESEAIRLLATYIQSSLSWDIFCLDWTKDPRLASFLAFFPGSKFSTELSKGLTSLRITLPDDYQAYLSNNVNKETRRIIRRRTKFIKESKKYKIRYSTALTVDRDIDALCNLWFKRWQKKQEVEWHSNVMHHFFEKGLLKLSLIWDGETPVSAVACIIDPQNKTYNAYITSYNPDYSKISPGFVLNSESIKQAIAQHYKYYDFTLGLDPYKLSFGPKQYDIKDVVIKRKSLKTVILMLIKQAKRLKRITGKLFS